MEMEKSRRAGGSFFDHLEALRRVLLWGLAFYAVLFFPAWAAAPFLRDRLLDFAAPPGFKLHYFTLLEPFFVQLKVALALDLLVSLPVWLKLLWDFVTPALHDNERRIGRIPVIAGTFLAAAGAAVGSVFIVPAVVRFSLTFTSDMLEPAIGIGSFVDFALLAALGGALLFQFPLVLLALIAAGAIRLDTLRRRRGEVLVALLIAGALLTPPDVVSQILLTVPSYLLFEGMLLVARWLPAARERGAEPPEPKAK